MADVQREPEKTSPEVEACIERGQCTYLVTKNTFQAQPWCHCFTCGLIGDKVC